MKRFRVSPLLFKEITNICIINRLFPTTDDAAGVPCIPLEIKVLGVLRTLGNIYNII